MALLEDRYSPSELHDLAVELDGRPVPKLRVTEQQFEALCDEDVRAEWVDGEVIIMAPVSGDHADLSVTIVVPPIAIAATPADPLVVGVAFSHTLAASGGMG